MSGLPVGRVFGIPIRFHWSWLLLFGIISWSLASYFGFALSGPFGRRFTPPPVIPGMGRTEGLLLLGAGTTVLFGMSLLAHELAHSLVARANGIRVRGITLFFFGGVAEITSQPRTAGAEFRIAVVGPLMSLALAGLFWVLSVWPDLPRTVTIPGAWLAQTNLMLAAFNLLPGFPLDGGRVFRSAIWQWSGNARRATQIAAGVGRLVGFGFIGYGLYSMLQGEVAGGLWQIFIGTFLQNAAGNQAALSNAEHALHGLTVGQALGGSPERDAVRVPGSLTLAQLVDSYVLTGGHRVFLVTASEPEHAWRPNVPAWQPGMPATAQPAWRPGQPEWQSGWAPAWPASWQTAAQPAYGMMVIGLLTLEEIRRVPRDRWQMLRAADIALAGDRLAAVADGTPLMDALNLMEERHAGLVAVVEQGRLKGVLTRERAAAYVRLRHEMGL
jgi:Zn-dependent protease